MCDSTCENDITKTELFMRVLPSHAVKFGHSCSAITWGMVALRKPVLYDLSSIVMQYAGVDLVELEAGISCTYRLHFRVTNTAMKHEPDFRKLISPLPFLGQMEITYSLSGPPASNIDTDTSGAGDSVVKVDYATVWPRFLGKLSMDGSASAATGIVSASLSSFEVQQQDGGSLKPVSFFFDGYARHRTHHRFRGLYFGSNRALIEQPSWLAEVITGATKARVNVTFQITANRRFLDNFLITEKTVHRSSACRLPGEEGSWYRLLVAQTTLGDNTTHFDSPMSVVHLAKCLEERVLPNSKRQRLD